MAQQDEPEQSQDDTPQQIKLMRHMVDLAQQRTDMAQHRTRLAEQRTDIAQERTRLAEQRTDMAQERTHMAEQRTDLAQERTDMAQERTRMSAERSEMSSERSYMAAERTLSVWVRTALGLMVFGLAIDRFGLMLRQAPIGSDMINANTVSRLGGSALVAFGVLMAITTGLRFVAYARSYRRTHVVPHHHGPFLAPLFALLVAVFGSALLFLLLAMGQ